MVFYGSSYSIYISWCVLQCFYSGRDMFHGGFFFGSIVFMDVPRYVFNYSSSIHEMFYGVFWVFVE